MWFSVLFLIASQKAEGEAVHAQFSTQATVIPVVHEQKCSNVEFFRISGTSWFVVNTNFVKDTLSESMDDGLLDESVSNFEFLTLSEWGRFKEKMEVLTSTLSQKESGSESLRKLLDNLRRHPIIFTIGKHIETLGPGDTRIDELVKKYNSAEASETFNDVSHITIDLKALETSYVYTIMARRVVHLPKKADGDSHASSSMTAQAQTRAQDHEDIPCYLLQPYHQPDYMILIHELLHIFLAKQQHTLPVFPVPGWGYPASWFHQVYQKEMSEEAQSEYARMMQKFWSNNDEVAVIIGLPGVQGLITENKVRSELNLPLRIFHKGPSVHEVSSSMYEPARYVDRMIGDEVQQSLRQDIPLLEADYYALAKLFRHMSLSSESGSRALTPNVSSIASKGTDDSGHVSGEE